MQNEKTSEGSHRITVNGAELAYDVHGRGPFAIAMPGGPGFGGANLRMPEVEQHLTVIYVDPIGTGASARLADPSQYKRSRDVADLEALRAALDLQGAYLIGHSYGGFVALDHALAYPGAFARLVLYDTSPTTGEEWQAEVGKNLEGYKPRPWFAKAMSGWDDEGKANTQAELQAALIKLTPFYFHAYEAQAARWDAYFANSAIAFDRAKKATSEPFDVRARLGEIKVPTLVLTGATDFICPPSMAKLLDEKIPTSTLVTFAQSGHFAHVEEPAAFAAAVAAFVK